MFAKSFLHFNMKLSVCLVEILRKAFISKQVNNVIF